MPSYDLANKTVLITGASSGIGEYFAELFVNQACNVVLVARRHEKLTTFIKQFDHDVQARIHCFECDISDPAKIDTLMSELKQNNIVVDVLINNAGVAEGTSFLDTTHSDMRRVMSTNFEGFWYLTQQITAEMINSKTEGSIINIASILAQGTAQWVSTYAASKAAMEHASRNLALELSRHSIRINCIAPGYIRTPLNKDFFDTESGERMIRRIPQKRLGTYEDLAGAVLLLASPLSAYMTGSTITVDGGHVCRSL